MTKCISIKITILFGLWFIIFLPIYPGLVHAWCNNSNNTYGILVPLISAFFIWRKRLFLRKITLKHSKTGLLILSSSLLLYVISYLGKVTVVSRAMIISTLIGIILLNFGKTIFYTIAFPLFYLFFMVPVPDSILGVISFPLQLFASKVSENITRMISIPVYREGNILHFANTQLEITEACSGIRSLMVFITASVLFAYLIKNNKLKKIILLISVIPLTLATNIIRVTSTGILAHFFGNKATHGFLHGFLGNLVLIFGIMFFLAEFSILKDVK